MNEKLVPLVGIYSLTHNHDGGIDTSVFYLEREYDEAYDGLVKTAYKDWFGEELEGNVDDAYSKLCDQVGFINTIHPESSEFEVPWVTEMYNALLKVKPHLDENLQKQLQTVLDTVTLAVAKK